MITITCTEDERKLLMREMRITEEDLHERPIRPGIGPNINLGGMINWIIGTKEQTCRVCDVLNNHWNDLK